jgi:hypothetical protein
MELELVDGVWLVHERIAGLVDGTAEGVIDGDWLVEGKFVGS